jgi:virulence factor Mce-like protein
LRVDIADGSNLVPGNDVREGGFLIGLVSQMKPVQLGNGQISAQLILKLNQSNGKVPVDSTATVRLRSVLGLKYVDLEKGSSSQLIPDGGTLPISHTSVPVQVDEVFGTFDRNTRKAIQTDLAGYGDTFTGRGSAINDTVASLPELFRHLTPVARYLSDPRTGLTRFLQSLDAFMATVAPVAQVNSRLFTDMATTFEAISRDPNALESTISQSPPTLDVSTDSLKAQQPFLADLATLGTNLTPATAELKAALPDINPAIEVGTKTLARTPSLNAKLQRLMSALKNLAAAPGTNIALNGLVSTVTILNPPIRYLGPYVTVCDYWNYWWTYLSEHVSEATSFGFAQRALINSADPTQPNNVNSLPAYAPANGGGNDTSPLGGNEYFHTGVYGAAVDNQGRADCETGQRGYVKKLNYFDPLRRNLETDPHVPGDQGPTFQGRPHVPAAETFSRNPQTGPQLDPIPNNP